jgi:hypothetical protein
MKYYKVKTDFSLCQWVMPQVDEGIADLLEFDCQSKEKVFEGISDWFISGTNQQECSNFYTFGLGGSIIFDQKAYESKLRGILQMAGEIIPIYVDGIKLYILNVRECINVLDRRRSILGTSPYGRGTTIKHYCFAHGWKNRSSIFKIPETSRHEILTYSGSQDPEMEFYTVYHEENLSGLAFKEI